MKKQTGDTYQSSVWAKSLLLSEAKVGKSTFIIGSALGALPWQKSGGIVDKPENLHIITFDSGALSGVRRFLLETCGAKPEVLRYNVYNMEEDLRKVSARKEGWEFSFYNTVLNTLSEACNSALRASTSGTPVVVISSLTSIASALERGMAGAPTADKKGSGMDMSKWKDLARQVNEIRNLTQGDGWHALWEAHLYQPPATGQDKNEVRPITMQVSGEAGRNFANNVEQVFRIRRMFDIKHEGTRCDKVYVDTRPTLEFLSSGRNFNEALDPKEPCLTTAFKKLGLKVGGFGAKSSKPAVLKPAGAIKNQMQSGKTVR